MSLVFIYSFTSGADKYDVFGDYAIQYVQVNKNDFYISSGAALTDTGYADYETITKFCTGFVLNQATSINAFPYAAISQTPESDFCGYTPPSTDCNLTVIPVIKNAVNNTPSGRISVTVSPGGSYQYSLDGLQWQASNLFNNLYAATFTLYVQRPDGTCLKTVQAIVGMDVVETSPNFFSIPYKDPKHLYYFFKLIIGGVTTYIHEPLKWDGLNITGERDLTFHGYKFKYSQDDVTLGFDCGNSLNGTFFEGGKDLVKTEYELNGQDGNVLFQYGYSYFGIEYTLFPGKLDLNTYHPYSDRIECSILADDFDATFLTRQETKVSMNAISSFEGSDVVPPNTYPLLFHAKEILTRLLVNNGSKNYYYADSLFQNDLSLLPETVDGESSDISQSFTYPLSVISGDIKTLDFYQVLFDYAGLTDVNFQWNLTGTVDAEGALPYANVTFNIYYVYQQYNKNTDSYTDTVTPIGANVTTGHFFGHRNLDISQTINFTLSQFQFNVKDRIYFYGYISSDAAKIKTTWNVTQSSCILTVSQTQSTPATNGNVWFLDDVIRQTLNVIADNRYVFRSSFFERKGIVQLTDGCGSKNALTNGFQIRNFDISEKPLFVDFKTLINSLNAMYCIGIGYSTIKNVSTVRMERRDFFFQDVEILQITPDYQYDGSGNLIGIETYDEEVAKEFIYNEVKAGYNTYQTDGFNSLDEFNTETDWLPPITKYKATLEILSDLITSGYMIESKRRKQFADSPTESDANDDDIFFTCLRRISDIDWVTEKDEPFSIVNNLISPQTSYNLRVAPTRMLYNWFIWLKGMLKYKLTTDVIRNTFYVQNGNLETQFSAAETCPVGDVDKTDLIEKADIPLTNLITTGNIYSPEWVNVKCRLTPDKVQILNEALSGQYGSDKDYGYVMVKRPEGDWQAGWVYNLTYNYSTEACTIKMLKKYYTPQPVSDDCCPWLTVNGCYILANGRRLIA